MIYTNKYYYKKLSRVIKYIQVTIGLPLILSIDKSGKIKWYIYAAFAEHKYIRSHNDCFMTMGTVGAYVQSRKNLTPIFQLSPILSE